MLSANVLEQVRSHVDKIQYPVVLIGSLDDSPKSAELAEMLAELAALSERITVSLDGEDARRPSFVIARPGTDVSVSFAGLPLGHEFTSLILALLQVGGHPVKASPDTIEQIQNLVGDFHFETFMSLSCQNCPDVVQALNAMSVINPRIRHQAIDGALFQDEVDQREVLAVPSVFLNGEKFEQGRVSLEEIVAKLDTGAAAAAAQRIAEAEPFDVLVVGGGPAGASAAVYAARKGIRTGIVAERFGGQLLDTMAIENFISVPYTEGPKLTTALEQHVHEYDVEVMTPQRAVQLRAAEQPGGLAEVELASGATVRARSVILSPGARWRQLGVPGEQEYRNAGVTFCPHCDGPLFKGKRVAVIGGGNSGVEAAIDLAGIVGHVTLVEFMDQLRADDVLQRKLRSLTNVDVMTGTATTQILGDGRKVTGMRYERRRDSTEHELDLDGVFVQIGLLPNSEWLEGALELSATGEIVIDERGATSVPGVFAAGDATTVPYKQIVVSMGAGATASLSAFDHLIRTSAPEGETVAV
ncbi:MAG: alkyl hydroperoxide reductase subunit F [Actinobacteria bacterium]|nr:alkyl hydroperoxide reductase subunit F [Actinomycetota bacterium]